MQQCNVTQKVQDSMALWTKKFVQLCPQQIIFSVQSNHGNHSFQINCLFHRIINPPLSDLVIFIKENKTISFSSRCSKHSSCSTVEYAAVFDLCYLINRNDTGISFTVTPEMKIFVKGQSCTH